MTTAPAPFTLRWDKPWGETTSEAAMLGEVWIGMIGTRSADPGIWWWKVDGIDVKWIAGRNGEAADKEAAREAIELAWQAWLKEAGLVPDGSTVTTKENPAHAGEA